MPIVFTKYYNMQNDIANKLKEQGITKQVNPEEFENRRIERSVQIINSFAQSIRRVVKNSHFFIFNPKPLTDKGYHYKFHGEGENI